MLFTFDFVKFDFVYFLTTIKFAFTVFVYECSLCAIYRFVDELFSRFSREFLNVLFFMNLKLRENEKTKYIRAVWINAHFLEFKTFNEPA